MSLIVGFLADNNQRKTYALLAIWAAALRFICVAVSSRSHARIGYAAGRGDGAVACLGERTSTAWPGAKPDEPLPTITIIHIIFMALFTAAIQVAAGAGALFIIANGC